MEEMSFPVLIIFNNPLAEKFLGLLSKVFENNKWMSCDLKKYFKYLFTIHILIS